MEKTNVVKIGNKVIGGGNPIMVQSMLKLPPTDHKAIIDEINELEMLGCDIIRGTIPNMEAAKVIPKIVKNTNIPFVADIHFDYKVAIEAIKNGVHKVRINPGNIGGKERVREVVKCLKDYDIPVRIGVNSGSLEKDLLEKYGHPTPEALVESAYRSISYFNEFGYDNIVLSIKSSDVVTTIDANRLFREKYSYPLHLGVTEAGAELGGIVRSSIGLGSLLKDGIGDTIRVSLTGDSRDEVIVGREILISLGLLDEGVRVVSCPTCGRCKTDTLSIVKEIKEKTRHIKEPITVAVMGCAVNGPGEAKEADMGVACGDGNAVFFEKGEKVKSVKSEEIASFILERIEERISK
ncbi:flavodoxin-dependent (E)-4-hydroxy-3-methylbut-2-enyl-diphosphate synthase [Anaerofustis stercorihominis]|uniref:flavodoxin-dependent (E)-4-hydroxy-3-methylbut-2-enyl-diphosphate synthase n=1 Tax=Anaerofustis stercorihominis TaxID=214853 RepID=UPI00210F05B9|nr:flavodoxin-dependent (E)-4-hydroxy-3-methylbut-2-enyl-diphosphate synthase [Anaerofustis stercorihominis]MCQ4794936.1 flavodoxin-dependent (E)-4-hydroxy-3-methylbut-2-enyl-diphosphate synthase [Anaerofustis stercorihominis]